MSASSVDEIVDLFERWGGDIYDEEISQRDHALQCAALAVRDGAAPALVAAALLHDVGHLLDLARGSRPDGVDRRHEDTGAAWLRPLLPASVTAPIALHVRAKRHLVATDPAYAGRLSPGSVRSLAVQGGPMDRAEAATFAALPGAADALRLRRWDDAGKVDGLEVPPLAEYVDLMRSLAGAYHPGAPSGATQGRKIDDR